MLAYQFNCPKCDCEYQGAGEASALMDGPTKSIVCLDCAELQDVVVYEGEVEARLRDTTATPECYENRGHNVREWKHPGPCPKCGATMVRDETQMICRD